MKKLICIKIIEKLWLICKKTCTIIFFKHIPKGLDWREEVFRNKKGKHLLEDFYNEFGFHNFGTLCIKALQTPHLYSTFKERGNDLTWDTRGMLIGKLKFTPRFTRQCENCPFTENFLTRKLDGTNLYLRRC